MPRPRACKDVSPETRREITRFLAERTKPDGKLKRGAIAEAVRAFGRCRHTVSSAWKERDTERPVRSARGRPVAGLESDAVRAKLDRIASVPPEKRKTLRSIAEATGISKTTVLRLLNLQAERRAMTKSASAVADAAGPSTTAQRQQASVVSAEVDETDAAGAAASTAPDSATETLKTRINCSKSALEAPQGMTTHHGACHCGDVAFEFVAPPALVQIMCNCSLCRMKQNTHVIVPVARFRLLSGADALTQYTFNTRQAKHLFCKTCGVQAFFLPRSNPDGVAVTVACVDPVTVESVSTEFFDGLHWEEAFAASDMAKYSMV